MKCSLIICTYNWPDALFIVLKSVTEQSVLPDEIIIADDGSGKTTSQVIDKFANSSKIPVIHSWQKDKGCRIPHSRNRAIARAKFEYIIMIDGDSVLDNDFIKDHKKFSQKGTYIQGSRVLLQEKFTNKIIINGKFKKPHILSNDLKNKLNMLRIPLLTSILKYFKSQNINRIRGCNFSIYKDEIFKVNGFNESFITWGREDSEFVQRLFNIGIKKQLLKFSGIQYHLYHQEREWENKNDKILEDTLARDLKWCDSGIDRYSKSFY